MVVMSFRSQEEMRSMISANFSGGRVTVMATVSNLNPIHTMTWGVGGGGDTYGRLSGDLAWLRDVGVG